MEILPMDMEPIRVTAEGYDTLSYLLANPPPPTPKLLELFRETPLSEIESATVQTRHDEWRRSFDAWKAMRKR